MKKEKKEKNIEKQRNQQGKMVDKQTVNKTNTQRDRKKFHVQEQYNFSVSSSGVILQHPVLMLVFKQ
jgi:CRISPR/Cas system CMR-associated protein Cmr1 (group 7 of RAMP superfamily)